MEPRREELRREESKVPKVGTEERKKRFRLIKLEERIAPGGGCGGSYLGSYQGGCNLSQPPGHCK
jgi:hypothetical protein